MKAVIATSTTLAFWIAISEYALVSNAAKKEYIRVRNERAEVVRFDKNLFVARISTFKYNRTTTAFNATIDLKVDIKKGNAKILVQAYKFASNEYRLFPVIFDSDICSGLRTNYFGMQNLASCGNFSVSCPIKSGKYFICNWTPDDSHFPPHLVTGRFQINSKYMYNGSHEMAIINWYITIEDEWFKHIE